MLSLLIKLNHITRNSKQLTFFYSHRNDDSLLNIPIHEFNWYLNQSYSSFFFKVVKNKAEKDL